MKHNMKYSLQQRVERARELRAQGYNCSQCVVLAFDDVIGPEAGVLAKAAHGFGSGFGASGNVCGAISGTTMVLGLVYDNDPRPELYRRVREALDDFGRLEGAIDCRDLKGQPGCKSCLELITDAVTLLHNRLGGDDVKD